ncbi:hypothetical protein CC80DRAFT_596299 [Byssothecium circinans]|uniref:Uncharacterized protein n=1 Tax=Byssothecium circinans TaxID=147558 RepID=A0A6A5TLT1_9PLEO|nr:hypothetical protein CC80DRAFT_596299 [Byssothecium circinans]
MSDSSERMPESRLEKQPERQHPFVPEPYGNLLRGSFQNILSPHTVNKDSIAKCNGKFVPEINLRKSLASMTEENRARLCVRAQKLYDHVTENTLYQVSESTWESDIRSDLFGLIRDDPLLRMDKTPYQYRYTDPRTSTATIRKRYPDITFGLATCWNAAVQHQIKERNGEITCDHDHIESHPSLTKERIFKQLFHRGCGLVVDPRWGAVDLIFPWAIFEAKKTSEPLQDAERQLYEGASIYLGMLDDLARDPKSPDKYQEGAAGKPQLFGFASSGRILWIYTIFGWCGDYIVEPLWQGLLDETEDALTALIIVDQLHEFAATTHRDFVVKHLEPWLQLAEEELESLCDDDSGCTSDDIASPSFRLHMLEHGFYKSPSEPLWKELEDAARSARSNKRTKRRREAEENMPDVFRLPDYEKGLRNAEVGHNILDLKPE